MQNQTNPNQPFKVGDTVIISNRVVDNYGYKNALPMLTPHGQGGVTAVVIATDYSECPLDGVYYPDCRLELSSGGSIWVDICFLKALPKRVLKPEVHLEKPKSPRLTPQCQQIINHLKKGHSITQRSALMDFNIMSLPRRIVDLKEAGYVIDSVIEKNNLTGQRYARYFLRKDDEAMKVAA